MKAQTLKGFRDFLPQEAKNRQYVMDTLKKVFESYGFEPLETPALEYEETLAGKYGEEGNKLMYRFKDLGDRAVAMRYDLTVPLARVVAQYQNELPMPFKRYQMQPVWRAENTQKGRYREFLQCDIDTVGTESVFADAQTIVVMAAALEALGFAAYKILLNDRELFSQLKVGEKVGDVLRSLDKLKKIGEEGVLKELEKNGFSTQESKSILQTAQRLKKNHRVETIEMFLGQMNIDKSKVEFAPYLARGLDYYTSTIFEIEIEGYGAGSVAGGGRYDNLTGMFLGRSLPAVGGSFGFDRIIEAMEEQALFPSDLVTAKVLVTCFPGEPAGQSLAVAQALRTAGINTDLYPDYNVKLDKQLKYADKRGIPYTIIIGPDEMKKNVVKLKNMKKQEQKEVSVEQLVKSLSS